MGGTGVVDRFLAIFSQYIDSGFGLLSGEVAFIATTLIVIDVRSDPRFSREPAFDRIEELVTQYSDRPLIIAGDFNTPLESIYLARLRQRMQNAFEARGSGLRDTWPVLLPVLSLDQVWANDRVDWHRCEHGWSLSSDHRPVLATFSTRR